MKSPWWKQGVIYQIYVRSFADSNGDGIGDLAGITAHLDYLKSAAPESLDVDAIWLTPFYNGPDRDFGYDVSDYRSVSPIYGSMEDFDRLLSEAHKRGIRVIIDFVPNHTSDEHPWFVESRASLNNPKRNWYIWRDGRGDGLPNNWRAASGGPAWRFDPKSGQYFYHAFFDFQPDLNWRNPEVKAAIMGDMRFWLEKGIGGVGGRRVVERFERKCPADGWPAYSLSNHDVPRHLGRLAGYIIYGRRADAEEKGKVLATMLLTLRGAPFMYYGEELGMTNRWFSRRDIQDPLGKKSWPLYQGRDSSRTPMLWEKGPGAGFTTGRPWLPLDPEADHLCVAVAAVRPDSLLNHYRKVIRLRREYPALAVGDFQSLNGPVETSIYRRTFEGQKILVALNFAAKRISTNLALAPLEALIALEKE